MKLHLKDRYTPENPSTPNRLTVGYRDGLKVYPGYSFRYEEATEVPDTEAKKILEQNGHIVEKWPEAGVKVDPAKVKAANEARKPGFRERVTQTPEFKPPEKPKTEEE
jgi:hypothetical protein